MKYIYTALLLLLIQGCGDADKSSTIVKQDAAVVIVMQNAISYTVYKGDKIVKTSDDAQVSILKNTQDDTSAVSLLQGSANIIRN